MKISSTLGSSDLAVRAVEQGYVPMQLRAYIVEHLVARFASRAGRAKGARERRREHSLKIAAAIAAEAGPVIPSFIEHRARRVQRSIAKRLPDHGLKRAPGVRTIADRLREMARRGSFGT